MATTQTVNIDVNANTQDANQEISRLENNIKTLDGAINLVGGSIATLAGGLALSGAVTEEQADRFQTAAIGAIALAEGSKRALEGFRVLVQETNLVAKAQRAYNAVLNANPIGLVITALAALTAAFIIFRNNQRDNADTIEDTNRSLEEQIALINESAAASLGADVKLRQLDKSAEVRNISREEAIRREREQAQAVVEAQNAEKIRLEGELASAARREAVGEEELKQQIELAKAKRDNAQAALDLLDATEILIEKQLEEQEKVGKGKKEAREKEAEQQAKALADAFKAEQDYLDSVNSLLMTESEARILNTAKTYDDLIEEAEQYGYNTEELEIARQAAIQAIIDDEEQKRLDEQKAANDKKLDEEARFRQQLSDLAVESALGTLSALKDLNDIFDSDSEEASKRAFNRSKALNIAEALVTTYSAAQKAYASQLIIGDPTSIIRAQVAAGVAIAGGLARVAVIGSQKFDGNNSSGQSPSNPGAGGTGTGPQLFGAGTTTVGGATGTVVPQTSGRTALRAYVVASDITTSAEEEGAIRRRRTL